VREHLKPANAVTSLSLTCGFVALVLVPVALPVSLVLVVLAAVLDVVDGALARRSGGDHTFGAQLDSLTDLLCFCVVPAYASYCALREDLPVPGAAAGCVFLLAGAWRLSRFPLVQRQGYFVGLPTPSGGGLLMLLALWAPAVAVLLGVAVLSALMVSSIRVPSVLAAVSVRPQRRPHVPRPRLRRRAGSSHVMPRARYRSSPGPGRPSRERAARVLRALADGRPRRGSRR